MKGYNMGAVKIHKQATGIQATPIISKALWSEWLTNFGLSFLAK
jgi:hypothetical protein